MSAFMGEQEAEVLAKAEKMESGGWKAYLDSKAAPQSTTVGI
jgi:hypothetical protein